MDFLGAHSPNGRQCISIIQNDNRRVEMRQVWHDRTCYFTVQYDTILHIALVMTSCIRQFPLWYIGYLTISTQISPWYVRMKNTIILKKNAENVLVVFPLSVPAHLIYSKPFSSIILLCFVKEVLVLGGIFMFVLHIIFLNHGPLHHRSVINIYIYIISVGCIVIYTMTTCM